MAKAKIIDSYSLECLLSGLRTEIEEADNQINVYNDESESEMKHRQYGKTIDRILRSRYDWIIRRDVLHQCLCKIQMHIKEIEI